MFVRARVIAPIFFSLYLIASPFEELAPVAHSTTDSATKLLERGVATEEAPK